MRSPEFEAMIAPAKLYPEVWRLLLGVLLIVFCYAGGAAILLVGLFAVVGPFEFGGWLISLNQPSDPVTTIAVFFTFFGMFLGPILAAAACHYRGPGTLFGPFDETLRGFLTVLAVTIPTYAILLAIGSYFDAPVENLAWSVWLRWLPFAIILLVIQVTAEELVFRGYLQQQLAARFRLRVIWMGLPSLLFAALHWNPMAGQAVWLILLATFIFALIAADLTERTGSLGAAIGLHLVNNTYGLTIIAMSGTITGLAKWTTPFDITDTRTVVISLCLNIVFLLALWRLLRWVLTR